MPTSPRVITVSTLSVTRAPSWRVTTKRRSTLWVKGCRAAASRYRTALSRSCSKTVASSRCRTGSGAPGAVHFRNAVMRTALSITSMRGITTRKVSALSVTETGSSTGM